MTNSIVKAVEARKFEKDYLLPSIKDLSYELGIARNIVERAYRYLKKLSIINSFPGKGYVIGDSGAHKKIIYDAFVMLIGSRTAIDFYIYNNDFNLFKKRVQNRKENYTYYIIIAHFL